jgi:ABC-type nitrate/sulfonate/bicarbonate transport system substrate-binding protein
VLVASASAAHATKKVAPFKSPKAVSLTLGVAAPSPQQPAVYWAQARGIFKRLGLNLTVVAEGSTEPALAAAGQLVIGLNTISQSYPPILAGQKLWNVDLINVGNSSDAITVQTNSPYHTVMDLSGQTVGVVGTSGYSRGGAILYSRYIVKHGGKPLNIVVQPDQNTLTAQLVNGSIAAAVFPPVFGPQIQAGVLRQMLSAKSPLSRSLMSRAILNSSIWGSQATIATHYTAIRRLIAGLRVADQELRGKTPAQIAAVLSKNPLFAPSVISPAAIAQEADEAWIGFAPPDQGYITKAGWDATLKNFASLGLSTQPINPKAAQFSYGQNVNMQIWRSATPVVDSYLAKYH